MNKQKKIALVIFNTISPRSTEYWGNLAPSILSGEMNRLCVDNDLYLLLMQVGNFKKNKSVLQQFRDRIRDGGYTMVYFDSLWLPEIKEMLHNAAPGTTIICRDDLTRDFIADHPEFSGNIDYRYLQPNFQYIRIGGAKTQNRHS
jgi:hypothetical protein